MEEPNEQHTERASRSTYCPDRRTAVSTIALALGGAAVGAFLPSTALGKAKKTAAMPKRFPIIYRLNGGANPKRQIKTVAWSSYIDVSQLKKPTRKGYAFAGWYKDKALSKKARRVMGRKPVAKRTLYAKWKTASYKISYVLNGGSFAKKQPTQYSAASREIVLAEPYRKGYGFAGWYADKGFKKRVYAIAAGSKGNKKFYAKWELQTYSITYELDGGAPVLALPASYTVRSSRITPSAPVRNGYRFVDWYADAALTLSQPYVKAGSAGNVTMYAKWVPTTYWDEHVDKKCSRVNKLAADTGGSRSDSVSSFVFITDMHVPSNALVSPDLVARVMQKTDASMVVFGGDAINKQANRADALAMIRFICNGFGDAEVHFVRGNHDANSEGSGAKKKYEIGAKELASLTADARELRSSDSLDYCRDDDERKVRYIFMDTGAPNASYVSTVQLSWLKKRILELGRGWTVLLFVHQFFRTYPKYDMNGKRIRKVLDSVYDNAKAQIAGVISGHIHHDRVEFSEKGYPMIAVTCDAYKQTAKADKFARKLGTTSEQAFDVVTLNTQSKMIYLTRIGAGKDRAYQYAEPEVAPVQDADTPLQAAQPDA